MTPEELLAAARRLVERPDASTAGVWPRAAAFLTRQALELAMAALWAAQPPAVELSGCSMRAQMLCLTAYVDQDAATSAAYLAAALSRACHYHSYELAPAAAELIRYPLAQRDHPPRNAAPGTRPGVGQAFLWRITRGKRGTYDAA